MCKSLLPTCLRLSRQKKKYLKGNVENDLENTRSLKQNSRVGKGKARHSKFQTDGQIPQIIINLEKKSLQFLRLLEAGVGCCWFKLSNI